MQGIIGYCRVSTREQGLSRNGLEGQRAEIERFARDNGFELLAVLEEVASGSLSDMARPVLRQAMGMARHHKAALVVSKLDRFSRSVSYVSTSMEGFKRAKVQFYSVDLGIGVDPFLMHLYASLAEKERMLIGERTKMGLAQVKAKGVKLGNHTNLSDAQAKGRATIQDRANTFALSVRDVIMPMVARGMAQGAIASELNARQVQTARGGKWSQTLVHQTVTRLKQLPE